ncbi:hypothetical protein [Mesorhizobium sp. M7A.T.Ca.US.000.02.2.1]|nr:hypothetical protein [Mesorhizobium sp. M7A.T.Ca.US.000.02.2.1]
MEACTYVIDDAARRVDERSTAYLRRGAGWSMKGDDGRAIADIDQAIRLEPAQVDA